MKGGTITAITFYAMSVEGSPSTFGTANQKVFLKEVSETTLDYFSGMTDDNVVFDGTLPMPTTTGGYTITFSQGYTYNGGNLLIGVYNDAKGSCNDVKWYGNNNQSDRVSAYGSSSASLDGVGFTAQSFLPKTTFTYTMPVPAGPTTSGIDWNPSTNSGTFLMPAYDVEVSTELWYILKQNGETPAANKSKTDVFLDRTLQAKVDGDDAWNTFCVPFPISVEKVTALGMTVKQLSGTSFSNGTLTLDFTDVTTGIAAGTPYLVRVASDLDFTADGNEFEGVSQDWETTHPVTPGTVGVDDWVTFVPVLEKKEFTGEDKTALYLGGARTLYYPSQEMTIKGFRAYFQLNNGLTAGTPAAGIRAFVLNLGDEETGIQTIAAPAAIADGGTYSLDGRKVQNVTRKGIYIVNGKKVVVK